jgi:hypothetical protein
VRLSHRPRQLGEQSCLVGIVQALRADNQVDIAEQSGLGH